MAETPLILTARDKQILLEMLRAHRTRSLTTPPREGEGDGPRSSMDLYVAKTPDTDEGLPAMAEDTPGKAECDIYRLTDGSGGPSLTKIGSKNAVYNVQKQAIAKDTWIVVARTKGGPWIAIFTGVAAVRMGYAMAEWESGTEISGSSEPIKVRPADPNESYPAGGLEVYADGLDVNTTGGQFGIALNDPVFYTWDEYNAHYRALLVGHVVTVLSGLELRDSEEVAGDNNQLVLYYKNVWVFNEPDAVEGDTPLDLSQLLQQTIATITDRLDAIEDRLDGIDQQISDLWGAIG